MSDNFFNLTPLLGQRIFELLNLKDENKDEIPSIIDNLASNTKIPVDILRFYIYYNVYNFNPPEDVINKLSDYFNTSFSEFIKEGYENESLILYLITDMTYKGLLNWHNLNLNEENKCVEIYKKLKLNYSTTNIYVSPYCNILAFIGKKEERYFLTNCVLDVDFNILYFNEISDEYSPHKINNIVDAIVTIDKSKNILGINYLINTYSHYLQNPVIHSVQTPIINNQFYTQFNPYK